jgi:nucleoid DNA-binding protein
MITQKNLIDGIAEETGITKKDVKKVLDACGELLAATIKDEDVRLFQGLTIGVTHRAPRVCRNPQTGEAIEVPARYVPKAKFGKYFKDAVN